METQENPIIEDHVKDLEKILKEKITSYKRLGGLTNFNYRLEMESQRAYLVKFFSKKNLEFFISRKIDSKGIKVLSKEGLYPKIIYEGEEFRIEEYIPHKFAKKQGFFEDKEISQKLVEVIHSNMTSLTENFKKDGSFDSMPCMLDQFLGGFEEEKERALEQLREKLDKSELDFYTQSLNELNSYVPKLQKKLLEFQEDVTVCHNDACFSNFLIGEGEFEGKVYLIDLEYTKKNYVYFELANLIHATNCRWVPNFHMVDESTVDPSDPQFEAKLSLEGKKEFVEYFLKISNFDFDCFYEVCDAFQAFAHFYWIFLAISTCDIEGIDFDCVGYVKEKMGSFRFYVDRFLNLKQN